jgi:hypothetical protein
MSRSRFATRAPCLLPLAVLAACSGSTQPASATGDGGDTNPNDFTVAIGPIDVPAGVETTQCIVIPFGNTQDVVVNSIDVDLAPGSHHLIVYATNDAQQTDPVNCSPFTGVALGSDAPLILANKEQATFTLPDGVAQEVPSGQRVKIEAHYINATASDLQGHGQVTFHTTPKASSPPYQPASFVFWGTTNINIPPSSSFSTGPIFQVGPAGTHLALVTTHEHRLGTRAQVWASAQPGDMSTQIADDKDWSNPSWRPLQPTFDFNGTNGLTFQCDWFNGTTQTISFGESALDEMCFVGGYYYPSTKMSLCIDGHCRLK